MDKRHEAALFRVIYMKICIKCNEEKRPSQFYTNTNWCKECYKARQRAYKRQRVYVKTEPLVGFNPSAQAFCLRKA